jgi:hypothetical protein
MKATWTPAHDTQCSTRAGHNTNVYPRRPDRAYIGYIDGGAVILDISTWYARA